MYLQAMETRCNKFNIEPSENENQMLARLLRDHDEQVSAFKTASDRLRNANPEAFDALWIYINEINSTSVPLRAQKFTNQPDLIQTTDERLIQRQRNLL